MSKIWQRAWTNPTSAALAVVAFGSVLTLLAFAIVGQLEDAKRQAEFDAKIEQSVQTIDERLTRATDALDGLHALFELNEVPVDHFSLFSSRFLDVGGLRALEFTRAVDTNDIGTYEKAIQANTSFTSGGYPEFSVHPRPTERDAFIVELLEPISGNEPAFGFDLGSEATRREAIEHARDTGELVVSRRIDLVQEDDMEYGVLLIRPLYSLADPVTVEQRRESFIGVVNGVFMFEGLLAGVEGFGSDFSFDIFDGGHVGEAESQVSPLFLSQQLTSPDNLPDSTRMLQIGDRNWILEARSLKPVPNAESGPTSILVSGLVASIALGLGAFAAMTSRKRAAQAAEDATTELRRQARELEIARDDAQTADRLKSLFLANMSHELRTPLNAVIGLSSVLDNETFGPLTEKQRSYIATISREGDHLLHLIEDLLDLSRIESGKDELHTEDVDLGPVFDEVVATVGHQARMGGVTINTLGHGFDVHLTADRRKLRQVLINLLSNAIKFSPDGGHVTISVDRGHNEATITVEDEGAGIPDDQLEAIFEPFHQINSSLSRREGGTGLGLTLSKEIVEHHGGTISVESEVTVGSRFIVTWPLGDSEGDASVFRSHEAVRLIRGLRVLVAEDNEASRIYLVDLLDAAGADPIQAVDGSQALQKAKDDRPDLVLLDIQLPVVDGLEVARSLKGDPATAPTPIIAVTAQAMPAERQAILDSGCDGYLAKPFTDQQLYAAMSAHVPEPASL